ncbi:MAG: phenylacetic acid degradation protein [Flavobacteriales bacterium]|nr:phenylacetic acid degradation protein [Flavobacteriales bacterium]
MIKDFFKLEVIDVNKLSADSVSITFNTTGNNDFKFIPGQYITIKKTINDQDVRRSYSISSATLDNIEIGVKLVQGGLMSTFLTRKVKKGDELEVMPPLGNFYLQNNSENKNHYLGICAGSGITPILSMIRETLKTEKDSEFTLLYGNKQRQSVMFFKEIQELERKYQRQFFTYYAFSREEIPDCISGRLDKENLIDFFAQHKNLLNADMFFLCGPGALIDNTRDLLIDNNIKEENIYFERFNSIEAPIKKVKSEEINSKVLVCVDGDDFDFELTSSGKSILDASMDAGADVPFSCKGGVCCVCKAKVIEGEVEMDQNFSLSEEEVEQGFILTCQSHPKSSRVVIDFDEI